MNPLGHLGGRAIPQDIAPLQHPEARRIVETTLRERGFVLSQTPQGIIILENSAYVQIEDVNDLLSSNTYTDGWPRVLETRNLQGNLQIDFENIDDDMPALEDDVEMEVQEEIDMGMNLTCSDGRFLDHCIRQAMAQNPFLAHPRGLGRHREAEVLETNIEKVTKLLEAGSDVKAIEKLLAKKVELSPKNYAMLWQKFKEIAYKYIDSYPALAKHCPLSVLEETTEPELRVKLIKRGAVFQNDCFIDLVQKDPQNIFTLIKQYPKAARRCSEKAMFDLLNADHEDLFLKLLEQGAKVYPDHLRVAICRRHLKAADAIIDERVDLSIRFGPSHTTCLCLAVEKNLSLLVNKLIKAKANVNQVDSEQMTPLHFAAREGYHSIVESLINAGANVLAENRSGCTPRDLAGRNEHPAVAAMLLIQSLPRPSSSLEPHTLSH